MNTTIPTLFLYNKLLKKFNNNYPFNLIDNIKDNVIITRNELELEYSKDLDVYKEKNINVIGKNEIKINVYLF